MTTETLTYGGPYKNYDRAQMALEDMYANGEVCDGERPQIVSRSVRLISTGKPATRYYVTLTYVS